MTKERALVVARGIWSDAGNKSQIRALHRPKVADAWMRYSFITESPIAGLILQVTRGHGETWEAALRDLELSARGTSLRLLPEEAESLLRGEVPAALCGALERAAQAGRVS